MQWWNDFMSWLTSDDGWRVVTTAIIPFLAILIAGLLAAVIARGSSRRILEFQDRELKAAAVLALIGAGRKATVWSSLGGDEKQRVDNQLSEADIRIRLLPVNGANAAGDWAAHELAAMKKNSASFSFQADQTFVDFRDRLLEWQNKPKRARKLFAYDLEQWRYEDEAVDKSLVQKQQEWAANQVDETPLAASVASATAAAATTPATAPVASTAPVAPSTPEPAAAPPVAPTASAAIPMPAAAAVAEEEVVVEETDDYAETAVIEVTPAEVEAPIYDEDVEQIAAGEHAQESLVAEQLADEDVIPDQNTNQPVFSEPLVTHDPAGAESAAHNYASPATEPQPAAYHADDSETEPETRFLADTDDERGEGFDERAQSDDHADWPDRHNRND